MAGREQEQGREWNCGKSLFLSNAFGRGERFKAKFKRSSGSERAKFVLLRENAFGRHKNEVGALLFPPVPPLSLGAGA